MLLDGRGQFLVPLRIPGLDGDTNSSTRFAVELCGRIGQDCAIEPVELTATPFHPKKDSATLRAERLIFERLLDVKDALYFYELIGDTEKLSVTILEAQLLSREIDSGYKESKRQLAIDANYQPNFKVIAQEMFDILGERMNPYTQLSQKYGVRQVRLSGFKDGDYL